MSHKQGHIFFIMGVAGAGKDTLIHNLKSSNASEGLDFSISYKARKKRESEVDGREAHFVTEDEFEMMIKNDEFLEYEYVHKLAYYGTKKTDMIENGICKGKIIIKEIDIEGIKSIYKNHPEIQSDITSVFLNVSVGKMRERVALRGDTMSELELKNREESMINEVEWAKKVCDYIIDTGNMTPEEVLNEVVGIIEKKRK